MTQQFHPAPLNDQIFHQPSRYRFCNDKFEGSDLPCLVIEAEEVTGGGDAHVLGQFKRIYNPDELYELVNRANAVGRMRDWYDMAYAPRDRAIAILFRHDQFQYATTPEERAKWQEVCTASWVDHNGGGWMWHGIAGAPIAWTEFPDLPERLQP